MGEEQNYPIVRAWLERGGYYCGGSIEDNQGRPIYFQNKGTKRLRIDVAGIRNVGTWCLDVIEVVAIEVKNVKSVQYRDLQDAFAYSQYAYKCYLATTGSIDKQDKADAHALGIGLLTITGKKVKEILSPKLNVPIQERMLQFLSMLEVAKCPICGSFFETYIRKNEKYKSFYKTIRPKYFEVARDRPNTDIFIPVEIKKLARRYKTYRYICRSCLEEFFPHKVSSQKE